MRRCYHGAVIHTARVARVSGDCAFQVDAPNASVRNARRRDGSEAFVRVRRNAHEAVIHPTILNGSKRQ
jgi:hypothetical protein